MKRLIKLLFSVLFVFCSFIFISMYIIGVDVSESYKVNRGEDLRIEGFVPVTAVYNGVKTSQSMYECKVGEKIDVELKLFGIIPFSTVNVEIVDQMYVEALGTPFGMKIYTDGVLVIESSDVISEEGKVNPAAEAGIKVGDYIKSINGEIVTCNEDVLEQVTESQGKALTFEVIRNKKSFSCTVVPIKEKDSGLYRIGIWVRDSSAGIGTLTFYSPTNDVICGLGHGICDADTEKLLEIQQGELVEADIVGVKKGSSGDPGSLKGKLTYDSIADILLNCDQGVYGIMNQEISTENLIQIALKQQVSDGKAQILCTVDGDTPKLYDCEIKKIGGSDSKTQNLNVTITDKELIEITGGIVQGMSGSPILQDGKLVGALTHVRVADSLEGYGIYAENMLETAESVAKEELKRAS